MSPALRIALRWACCVLLVLAGACDQPAPEERALADPLIPADSAVADTLVADARASTYDAALGAFLIVPAPGDLDTGAAHGAVISPLLSPDAAIDDTTDLGTRLGLGEVVLLSRSGVVAEATVSLLPSGASGGVQGGAAAGEGRVCAAWPRVTVAALAASPGAEASLKRPTPTVTLPASSWLVGFPRGMVVPVVLDSIEQLSSRDSSMLVTAFTRLASALHEDSSSSFRGLPFTVTRAFRTTGLSDGFALVTLVRRIPQEDRPLEERTVLLVGTSATNTRQWKVEWFERTNGREEEVITSELLSVLLVTATGAEAVLLGRDDGTGTALALLERRGNGWYVRWESPVTGC